MKNTLYLLPALLWLSSCGGSSHEAAKPHAAAGPAIPVNVATAGEQQWQTLYEASGTVRARATADVAAKLLGYVREVKVQLGDRVRAGQLLVTLDTRDLDVNARRAEAALEEVKSAAPEADSAIAAARSNLDLAQSTFNRMQDLFTKKSISNQEFDEASAKLKAAQAAYAMAQARRKQLDAQAARVQQDVRASEVTRGYADIVAPFAGIVTAKTVEPGILASPGSPLLTIEREGSYRLEAAVEESRMAAIRVGQAVTVTLDGLDRTLAARVSEIVPAVDAASRSNVVKIDLPPIAALRSGAFGRVTFSLGSRSALTIPVAAVLDRGQLQSVLVVENGFARLRLITAGQKQQDLVEVLSGLTAGDKIVTPARRDLADGAKVPADGAKVEVRP